MIEKSCHAQVCREPFAATDCWRKENDADDAVRRAFARVRYWRIPPHWSTQDYGEIDAFAIRVDGSGVFLHSANDLHPRQAVITDPGCYKLRYLLYAHGFPPTDFTVTLKYDGAKTSTASLE